MTNKTLIGETPFVQTYGSKVIIPIETGIPNYRVQHFNEKLNEEGLRGNLDLVEELRTELS